MAPTITEFKTVLEEESRKHGWGLILVAREEFTEFLRLTKPKIHLDIGCHRMLLADIVREAVGAEYIGLDVWHYNAKIHVMASGDRLPFRPNSVDTVSLIEVLEHIPMYPCTLRQCFRIARKGVFFQSVICTDKCALADRTHFHVLHPQTLTRLLKLIGFREIKHGMKEGNFWLYAIK